MFQICHCGTQPGYQHDAACPFPLFTDDDASVERWARERAALVRDLAARVRDHDHAAALAALDVIDRLPRPTVADLQYQQRAREEGWPHHDWTAA